MEIRSGNKINAAPESTRPKERQPDIEAPETVVPHSLLVMELFIDRDHRIINNMVLL